MIDELFDAGKRSKMFKCISFEKNYISLIKNKFNLNEGGVTIYSRAFCSFNFASNQTR